MSELDPPPFDESRITQVLDRHGVEYVLVGGLGARLHGAVRPTRHFDLCPAWDMENLRRLASTLRELAAALRGMPEGVELPPPTAGGIHQMTKGNWRTDAGYLDVLMGIPTAAPQQLKQYAALRSRAETREVAGCTIYVAALGDIIVSKEAADREKDREALPELRALQVAQLSRAAYPEGLEAALGERDVLSPPVERPGSSRDYGRDPPGRTLT